jgi:Na+/H+ antiporter NhaD/arsenite permease-like protein
LFACAFIANAASFVFPISNPANLVVFSQHMPPLGMWLRIFLLPSTASILLTFLCLRWVLRRELRGEFRGEVDPVLLSTEGKLLLWDWLLRRQHSSRHLPWGFRWVRRLAAQPYSRWLSWHGETEDFR